MTDTHYRLAALDIDGTVLDSGSNVCGELKKKLGELSDSGVRVALCTGRRWRSSKPVFDQIEGLSTYVICCGGALIKETESGRTVYTNPLEDRSVRRGADLYRRHGIVPMFCFDRPLERKELEISEMDREAAERLKYVRRNRENIEFISGPYPETEDPCLEIYAVDVLSELGGCEEAIAPELGANASVRGMIQPRYGEDYLALEIHHATATKWTALGHLMEMWDISAEEVIAIGDDVNDIPMLRAAGLSFAMGNAEEEVKQAADRVTASNDDHGAAVALERVFGGTPAREAE